VSAGLLSVLSVHVKDETHSCSCTVQFNGTSTRGGQPSYPKTCAGTLHAYTVATLLYCVVDALDTRGKVPGRYCLVFEDIDVHSLEIVITWPIITVQCY
jgi:hypothetical protein